MAGAMGAARADEIEYIGFGDLFLEDVRAYREHALSKTGIAPRFPLWGESTARLAYEMLDAGIRAVLTCVDPAVLSAEFVGRDYNEAFLADLPSSVDPCGERGEFHTFVWDSPDFYAPIGIRRGASVTRDGFVFCDIMAADSGSNQSNSSHQTTSA